MIKKWAFAIIVSSIMLLLAACGGNTAEVAIANELRVNEVEEIETETEENQDIEDNLAVDDIEEDAEEDEDVEEEQQIETTYFAPPTMEISEYGRQVAIDFLSEMTTIFTGLPRMEIDWGGTGLATGRFEIWDFETFDMSLFYETPEIYFGPMEEDDLWANPWVFFDGQGNRIYDAPWLYAFRGDGWSSYSYAGYFRLFDFDGNGIPDIFIHFNQTFDGGYAGFYRIFKYINGQYRMLEMDGWFSAMHDLFWDDSGRIITFIDSDYHGIWAYEHLVLTNHHAELHLVTAMGEDDWDAWVEHHWSEWGQTPHGWNMLDGWLVDSPTIFGTDIALFPVHSLTSLEDEITAIILEKLGLNP